MRLLPLLPCDQDLGVVPESPQFAGAGKLEGVAVDGGHLADDLRELVQLAPHLLGSVRLERGAGEEHDSDVVHLGPHFEAPDLEVELLDLELLDLEEPLLHLLLEFEGADLGLGLATVVDLADLDERQDHADQEDEEVTAVTIDDAEHAALHAMRPRPSITGWGPSTNFGQSPRSSQDWGEPDRMARRERDGSRSCGSDLQGEDPRPNN